MPLGIEQRVRAFISENFPAAGDPESLGGGMSLIEGGFIDSLGVLSLVAFLEENFEITVSDDDMVPENLDTIDAILAFIDRKRGAVG